jgi:glycosyltransferase involved in cell wall biosynthesis
MIKVLHITAHLGGGVGRVLSRVALFRKERNSEIEDIIVCLEPPHKEQVIKTLRKAGVVVEIAPDSEKFDQLIESADIVQLEWWHHPLLAQWLSKREQIFSRLVIWSHTSGLHYPVIPASFIALPHVFLFTTPVSLTRYNLKTNNTVDVVHSSGGFEDMPVCQRDFSHYPLTYGYTGTINPAKIHPQITDFIAAVNVPEFAVEFYGDPSANPAIEELQKNGATLADRIHIRGFIDNLYDALKKMDIFVYILNPTHYGTTENGLLEAMACGVVPVVFNNPVETSIVKNGVTGMVVDSPAAFALAIKRLNDDPQLRQRMSESASADVRSRFSIEVTERELQNHYMMLMDKPKQKVDFKNIFGSTPWEWFSSCLGEYKRLFSLETVDISQSERLTFPVLYEKSKSSVFQYKQYFPDDPDLKKWTEILEAEHALFTTT